MKTHKILNILMLVWATTTCFAQSLNFTNNGTWANIGDIDIQGNQITVEALIYMDDNTSINIVSKHTAPWNVNYLLRPFTFELTTYVNGNSGPTQFLQMWNPFTLDQNKWYHIAGTYNGMSVKYYVDGCLVIEQPFSGNLFQNNFLTAIGNQSTCQCEQFLGKIDEVRIWNVCRTEGEIRGNMLNLPNPALQTGLVAYYKLDNSLVNNQGNSAWNGTLVGNVQFASDQASIQPFAISSLQTVKVDCENISNGSITISTNRPNTQYSLDNINFQTSNTFSNLADGVYQVYAKSPEGCIIDTMLTINNDLYVQTSQTVSICQGETYNGLSNSGTYIDTIQATLGCDSIQITNLTVLPNPTSLQSVSICQGEMYEGYSSSGTYSDVFTAANGCDSTRTLVLTVLPNSASTQSVSICQGEVYQGYSSSGTYSDVFIAANGCDSTRTLVLTVVPTPMSLQSVSICQGEMYEGYSSSGTYIDVFTAANGCDSIRTLNLAVLPNLSSTQAVSICQGETYEGHSMSGIYVDTLQAASGCDSIRTLTLTVVPNLTSLQSVSICQGEMYEGYSSSGTYIDIFTAANGCDSTRTLMLTVLPNASSSQTASICQGEMYEGYSLSGTYSDVFTAANGCDSTRTLLLTVLPNAFSSQTASICQGEMYEGYSSSGTYSDVFTAVNGCDSTRTLVLTVLSNPTSMQSVSICQGEVYEGYSSSGTYVNVFITANGCDSTRTLMLTVLPNLTSTQSVSICQGEMYEGYSSSGTYIDVFTAANGCDSTRTLVLTVNANSEFSQNITICAGSIYDFNGQSISNEGMYSDTLISSFGCDSIVTVNLKIARDDFLGNDVTLCNENEYELQSPSENTHWFDNTIGIKIKVNSTGNYWATILDASGCEIIDTVFVRFNFKSYVPNVFSPNDDGKNDCFQPFFSELGFSSYRFSVFDRWGSHIFSTENPSDCWDGKNKDKECSPGVYTYFVQIKTEVCGKTLIKGDVTLIK